MAKNNGKSFGEEAMELGGFGIIIAFVIYTFFPAQVLVAKLILLAGFSGVAFYLKTFSKYNKIFKALNLGHDNSFPLLKSKVKKSGYYEYTFTLPNNKSVEDFKKVKDTIQQAIGAELDFEYRFKTLIVKEYTEKIKSKYPFEFNIKWKLGEIPIVYMRTVQLITLDLFKGTEPNLLIASGSGGGKSTLLRSIITTLIMQKEIELFLIDLKRGAEFNIFKNVKQVKELAKTNEEAYQVLKLINAEIDYRYDLIADNNCIDIKEYNKKYKALSYKVVVVDEFADLSDDDNSINLLRETIRKCRACGIAVIISTQRPSADVLEGMVKANIANIVGLRVINDTNSRIIGIKGLENLTGEGHAIFRHKTDEYEGKCPYLEPELARELIKPFEIDKRNKNKEPEIIDVKFTEVFDSDYQER
jgi:S-DNA-T family DNA segregation ATPase FtsK/SpoIIIE